MRIEKIIAYRDRIEIHAEKGMTASAVGRAYVPVVFGETGNRTPARLLYEVCRVENGCLVFPRYVKEYDLLICRFLVTEEDEIAAGVCYVTDMDAEISRGNVLLAPKGKAVGTWVTCPGEECIRSLSGAARQTAI